MARSSDREAIEGHGYDTDCTPIDTLMAGPLSMHLDVAAAMENDDETENPYA
jgi:hypothetical protein